MRNNPDSTPTQTDIKLTSIRHCKRRIDVSLMSVIVSGNYFEKTYMLRYSKTMTLHMTSKNVWYYLVNVLITDTPSTNGEIITNTSKNWRVKIKPT